MGLDNLDKETRAAMTECFEDAINGHEGLTRAINFFADEGDKGVSTIIDQQRDLAESVEELETRMADQDKTITGAIGRIERSIRGEYGSYRGVFPSEDGARSFGLLMLGSFGDVQARETIKTEYRDVYDRHERALSGNVIAEGGALLPGSEMLNTILWLVESYGVISAKVSPTPIGSKETVWVKDTGEPFMNVRGELEQAITENSFQLEQAAMRPREFYTLYFWPRSLEQDSAVSLGEMVARRFAWAFAYHMDNDGFNGEAGKTHHGIHGIIPKLKAIAGGAAAIVAASGVTDFANVTDAHLLTVQGNLPEYADASNAEGGTGSAEFYMHRKFFFGAVTRLARAVGGLTAEEFAGRRRLAYNGSPINIAQVLPSAGADGVIPCVFGDLDQACMRGVKREMEIRRSDQVRWLQDQIAAMATKVQDFVVQNIGDSNEVEAITALQLAA